MRRIKLLESPLFQPYATLACLLFSTFFLFNFLFVALSSITYPFHLEWMEGQTIDVIARIIAGKPLYVEPTLEYVPFIYTPLYYYASAFVAMFTGIDFFAARFVSLASALGIGALIYAWMRKEGSSRTIAISTCGIFYATYPLSGRWLDIGRTDSLYMVLLLGGLYVLFHYRSSLSTWLAALLLVLAFFTKQSALIAGLPLLYALIIVNPTQVWHCTLRIAGMALVGLAAANGYSEGWFSYYVFQVPAGHSIDSRYIAGFWTRDMLYKLPILVGLALIGLGLIWQKDRKRALLYGALVFGLIMSAYMARIHSGGWQNVLIPMHLALTLLSGMALVHVNARSVATGNNQHFLIVLLLLATQLSMLVYNPTPLIPTAEDKETGEKFVERVGQIEGDVFIPELQFVQTRAGKTSYAFGMAAHDVIRAKLRRDIVGKTLADDVRNALQTRKFGAVVPGKFIRLEEREGYYTRGVNIPYPRMVTGGFSRASSDFYFVVPEQK